MNIYLVELYTIKLASKHSLSKYTKAISVYYNLDEVNLKTVRQVSLQMVKGFPYHFNQSSITKITVEKFVDLDLEKIAEQYRAEINTLQYCANEEYIMIAENAKEENWEFFVIDVKKLGEDIKIKEIDSIKLKTLLTDPSEAIRTLCKESL